MTIEAIAAALHAHDCDYGRGGDFNEPGIHAYYVDAAVIALTTVASERVTAALGDLWENLSVSGIKGLDPETVQIAQSLHEREWHPSEKTSRDAQGSRASDGREGTAGTASLRPGSSTQ